MISVATAVREMFGPALGQRHATSPGNAQAANAATVAASPPARPCAADLAAQVRAQARPFVARLPALGPVAWLMLQQPAARHTLVSELDWRVLPALVLDQCKLYLRDGAPLAWVSWARLSQASAERYRSAPHHLCAADWRSGDQVWIVDLFAPFGGESEVLADLRENVFAGIELNRLMRSRIRQARAMRWPAHGTKPGAKPP